MDILVNNAGGGTGISNGDALTAAMRDAALFAANVDLNLHSAYRASRAVIDGMAARGYGRIINIGSGYAKRSGGSPAYTAAKHGLIGLTRAMAAQVATKGVTRELPVPGLDEHAASGFGCDGQGERHRCGGGASSHRSRESTAPHLGTGRTRAYGGAPGSA